jgi:hypothetical protein
MDIFNETSYAGLNTSGLHVYDPVEPVRILYYVAKIQ